MDDSGEQEIPRHFSGIRYSGKRNCLIDVNDTEVSLRPKSLSVFRLLANNHGTVVTKQEINSEVWPNVIVGDDSLAKCVSDIRQIFGENAHSTLKTIPKRGYMLIADPIAEPKTATALEKSQNITSVGSDKKHYYQSLLKLLLVPVLALSSYWWTVSRDTGDSIGTPASQISTAPETQQNTPVVASTESSGSIDPESQTPQNSLTPENLSRDKTTTLSLNISEVSDGNDFSTATLFSAMQVAFSRYRTVDLTDSSETDYKLELSIHKDHENKIYVSSVLLESKTNTTIFAEKLTDSSSSDEPLVDQFAARISAMVASPGSGALGRHLLTLSRNKPLEQLTRSECYAHGYDCTNCSGELDSVNQRAEECIRDILDRDKFDSRAWGLQSTIYAHQYQWSTNLGEPLRTNVKARSDYRTRALAAANKAEQLSDGRDSAVYWGMAQAYMTACDTDKMKTAIERGININPHDPSLLAVFGNWMAYTGNWDEGAVMVNRALELEPTHYKRWWLFGPAKRHYIRGEYEQALALFKKAFNERNWLSHLQLSYTLPYLNRLDEARHAAERLQYKFPGITVETALQLYKLYCFPDDYLQRMKTGLIDSGVPQRGDSSDLNDIKMPMAKVERIGDFTVEYMDLGSGTPFVFVHGSMSDYRSWAHYQNPVSEKHRYISYSRRYYGSQPWPDDGEHHTNKQAADDLAAFIDHLNLGPAVIVSWSSATPIASILAAERPELVKAMALYEPNFGSLENPDDPTFPAAAKKNFFATFARMFKLLESGDTELATKAFLEIVFQNQPGDFENELMAVRRIVIDSSPTVPLRFRQPPLPDTEVNCGYLKKIAAPTLVMHGELTNDYWTYLARRYKQCVPNAMLVMIDDVNHAGPIRKPLVIYDQIEQFVATIP